MKKHNCEKVHERIGRVGLLTLVAVVLFMISGFFFASARDVLNLSYNFFGFSVPGWGLTFIMLVLSFIAAFCFFYVYEEKPRFFELRHEVFYFVPIVCIIIAVSIVVIVGESLWKAILLTIIGILISIGAAYILKETYGDIIGKVVAGFGKSI